MLKYRMHNSNAVEHQAFAAGVPAPIDIETIIVFLGSVGVEFEEVWHLCEIYPMLMLHGGNECLPICTSLAGVRDRIVQPGPLSSSIRFHICA